MQHTPFGIPQSSNQTIPNSKSNVHCKMSTIIAFDKSSSLENVFDTCIFTRIDDGSRTLIQTNSLSYIQTFSSIQHKHAKTIITTTISNERSIGKSRCRRRRTRGRPLLLLTTTITLRTRRRDDHGRRYNPIHYCNCSKHGYIASLCPETPRRAYKYADYSTVIRRTSGTRTTQPQQRKIRRILSQPTIQRQ